MQYSSGRQSAFLQEYLEESEDLINEIEEIILDLEKEPSQEHLLDCLMRTLHSFKGSAQLMGLDPIVTVAHAMETLVSRFRHQEIRDGISVPPGEQDSGGRLTELNLRCVDLLRTLSDELKISGACMQDVSPVLAEIDKVSTRQVPSNK